MSRFAPVFFAGMAFLIAAAPVRAQTSSDRGGIPVKIGPPPSTYLGDFESARFSGPGDNFLQEHLRQSAERSFTDARLTIYSERFLGIERYEATGLELMLEGVGPAATLGLLTGALANTAGLWDENTSWYIAGAAAALGAFLGYRQVNDPKKRTRYRWSIDVDSGSQNP